MKKYLLDTNHLSNALHANLPLRERIFRERRTGSRFATCWAALCELEAGLVHISSESRHRRMLTVVMREVRIWSLDWHVVNQYGVLSAKAKKIGRAIGSVDLMLASLGWTENAILLTADQDFQPFTEVTTENWIADA
jgi:tRNA(fMet)-specific endonuclease VapC